MKRLFWLAIGMSFGVAGCTSGGLLDTPVAMSQPQPVTTQNQPESQTNQKVRIDIRAPSRRYFSREEDLSDKRLLEMARSGEPERAMLIAYDDVMNDLLLVDEGLFADSRIPRKTGERHAVASRVRIMGVRTESQFQIVSLRKHNAQSRIELGDGLVSANGDKIRSWDGSKGATSVTNQIRSDQILRAALPRLSKAAAKSPGNVVSMDLESAKLYARAAAHNQLLGELSAQMSLLTATPRV